MELQRFLQMRPVVREHLSFCRYLAVIVELKAVAVTDWDKTV